MNVEAELTAAALNDGHVFYAGAYSLDYDDERYSIGEIVSPELLFFTWDDAKRWADAANANEYLHSATANEHADSYYDLAHGDISAEVPVDKYEASWTELLDEEIVYPGDYDPENGGDGMVSLDMDKDTCRVLYVIIHAATNGDPMSVLPGFYDTGRVRIANASDLA